MFTYDHDLGYFLHKHKYVFSFTHELTFRYFIYEHKHFLENSLYIHMNIHSILNIHVSSRTLSMHINIYPSILCLNTYITLKYAMLLCIHLLIHGNSYYLTFININSLAWLDSKDTLFIHM